MAYYLLRAKYAQDAMSALVARPEDRMITTTKLLKGIGGRLHYYFFCFGEFDIVLLFELPDQINAAALSMVLQSAGTVTAVETTPLMTMEDAIAAMQIAGQTTGVYQPPGRGRSTRKGAAKRKKKAKEK